MTIISARLNDGRIRVLAVIEGRGKADIKSFLSPFRYDYKKQSKVFAPTCMMLLSMLQLKSLVHKLL